LAVYHLIERSKNRLLILNIEFYSICQSMFFSQLPSTRPDGHPPALFAKELEISFEKKEMLLFFQIGNPTMMNYYLDNHLIRYNPNYCFLAAKYCLNMALQLQKFLYCTVK